MTLKLQHDKGKDKKDIARGVQMTHSGLLGSFQRRGRDPCTRPVYRQLGREEMDREESHKDVCDTSLVTSVQCLPSEKGATKHKNLSIGE